MKYVGEQWDKFVRKWNCYSLSCEQLFKLRGQRRLDTVQNVVWEMLLTSERSCSIWTRFLDWSAKGGIVCCFQWFCTHKYEQNLAFHRFSVAWTEIQTARMLTSTEMRCKIYPSCSLNYVQLTSFPGPFPWLGVGWVKALGTKLVSTPRFSGRPQDAFKASGARCCIARKSQLLYCIVLYYKADSMLSALESKPLKVL